MVRRAPAAAPSEHDEPDPFPAGAGPRRVGAGRGPGPAARGLGDPVAARRPGRTRRRLDRRAPVLDRRVRPAGVRLRARAPTPASGLGPRSRRGRRRDRGHHGRADHRHGPDGGRPDRGLRVEHPRRDRLGVRPDDQCTGSRPAALRRRPAAVLRRDVRAARAGGGTAPGRPRLAGPVPGRVRADRRRRRVVAHRVGGHLAGTAAAGARTDPRRSVRRRQPERDLSPAGFGRRKPAGENSAGAEQIRPVPSRT